jgi:hypothetical protein
MLKRLTRHATPTMFVAILALVLAATGGAFAASGNGGNAPAKATTSATHATLVATAAKAKPKTKVVKGPAGPKGATGATGPAGAAGATGPGGPAGAVGPAGPAGGTGPQGPAGTPGTNGTNGTNGKNGTPGAIHPGETLPSGASETGAWVVKGQAIQQTAISFSIPLAAGAEPKYTSGCEKNPVETSCQVHYINIKGKEVNGEEDEVSPLPQCPGSAVEPKAEPGNLCIYTGVELEIASSDADIVNPATGSSGAATTGARLEFGGQSLEAGAAGTWAVTAP